MIADSGASLHLLHHHLLPALGPVRGGVLDQLPHPPRHRARPHGAPHHSLPRPRQHLQQHQLKLPEGGGAHGHRDLDAGLHPLRVR